ncbi:GIP, partial [Symbiodinium sp. CCMP2456]
RLSDYLFGDRYTRFFDSNGPSMIDTGHQNDWADIELPDGTVKRCDEPRASTGHKWIGYTLFVPLDRPKAGENEQETEDKNAVKPKGVKIPNEPSENERRLHELTHLPYRDWCEHCVRSKGRQNHAVMKNDRQPVTQIDFSFLSTENDLPKRMILSATDAQTRYSMAVVLPAKGSIEKYAVGELPRFVFEIGRTFGIVQYDKENALKVIAKDLCKTIGGLSTRAAPTGHSQSRGSVGNAQRTLCGQLRTLMSQVQESTGLKLTSESPMFTWCGSSIEDLNGSLECTLARTLTDTEADEVILANANGVFKEEENEENEQLEDTVPDMQSSSLIVTSGGVEVNLILPNFDPSAVESLIDLRELTLLEQWLCESHFLLKLSFLSIHLDINLGSVFANNLINSNNRSRDPHSLARRFSC